MHSAVRMVRHACVRGDHIDPGKLPRESGCRHLMFSVDIGHLDLLRSREGHPLFLCRELLLLLLAVEYSS
jgi:hypothetical protein